MLLLIALGLSLALGIYMYRFAKDNISIFSAVNKPDPALDAPPEALLPPTAGPFQRTSLADTLENVPEWQNVESSNAHVGVYEDPEGNSVTVIAIQSKDASADRETGLGVLTRGAGQGQSDSGVTIRNTFSAETSYVTTWSKPNWTYMVQTTAPVTAVFLEHFTPGSAADESTTTTAPTSVTMEPEVGEDEATAEPAF